MKLSRFKTLFAITAILFVSSVRAQNQTDTAQMQATGDVTSAEISRQWQVSVEGETITRTLDISNALVKGNGVYVLEAVYGVTDGKLSRVLAELRRQTDKWQLNIVTPINATVSAESADLHEFSGTIAYKNGTSKVVKIERASSARQWLSQPEIENLLLGKRVAIKRYGDGVDIYWQASNGGNLYAQNSQRNHDSAHWTFNAQGAFCLTWTGSSGDGCHFFFREGNAGTVQLSWKKSPWATSWGAIESP